MKDYQDFISDLKIKSQTKISREEITYELNDKTTMVVKINDDVIKDVKLKTTLKSPHTAYELHVLYIDDIQKFEESLDKLLPRELVKMCLTGVEAYNKISKEGFDENRLVYWYGGDDLYFDHNMRPISPVYQFDYIGCFQERVQEDKYYESI